jgi:hypothetical protein
MANRVQSILQIWDDIRNQWETVYASEAKPSSTATTINYGAGYNAAATSLTVASTTGILAGDYLKIVNELLQVTTVASTTVLNPVTRGQLTGTEGGVAVAAATIADDAVVTKMRLGAPALFKTQIEEKHGSPVICKLELFNRPHTTGSIEGYVQDKYANYLNEYDRIRVLDNHSKAILFYGRIYRKDIEFDQQYGSVIRITAFDALKELADNRIEGDKGQFTGVDRRSKTISKVVEKLTYRNAADVNINLSTISVGSAGDGDTQKFNASVATHATSKEWNYSKGRGTGLSAINTIAKLDPHTVAQGGDTPSPENGYSLFVDNGFKSSLKTTNYTSAVPTLNYFQRETIPDSSSSGPTPLTFYKMTYGTQESDGDSTNSYTTTVNTLSSFSVSKQYTDVTSAIALTYKEQNGDINTKTCYRAEVDGVAGDDSGNFAFETLLGPTISLELSPSISIDTRAYGTGSYSPQKIGQLLHIDKVTGDTSTIVFTLDDPYNSEDMHALILKPTAGSGKTSDFIRIDAHGAAAGGDPVSTGANRFKVTATSDVDVELLRTVPSTFDYTEDTTEVRLAIHEMFRSAQTTSPPTRADLSIIDFPFARLTVDPSSINTSTNVLTLPVDIYKYGARKGMVVRQLKSGAETGNYGYISAIVSHASSPTVTVVLNNEAGNATAGTNLPWTGTDTFVVYIPIRPGYLTYLTNSPANLTAEGLVTGLDYSEGMGIQTTHISLLTDNFAALNETNQNVSVGDAGSTAVVADSRKPVYFSVTAGDTTPMLTLASAPNAYRQVHWAAGTLTVGAKEYGISASNSTTALGGAYLAHDQWYTLYFLKSESITSFKLASLANLPRNTDLIHVAQLRASAVDTGSAMWHFDSSNVILSAEAQRAVDISDIPDGAIGSSKFARGAQPFSMSTTAGSATPMWTTSAYNAVAWAAATLAYSDGDTLVVSAGSQTGLSADTTYWAYVTTTSGGITLTTASASAIGDNKILVALIEVGGSGDVGASILPVGTQAHIVTAASIKEGAITGETIKTGTIIAGNIAADAITSDKIYAGAVITEALGVGAVVADKIGANEISATKLSSTALDASTITLTGTGGTAGKLVTAAGLGRSGTNQWTTMVGGGTEGGLLIDQYGIIGTSKSDDLDIDDTEFYISASDGKMYAGGGSIILDKDGLTIADDSSGLANARFKLADGTNSTLEFYCQGTPSNNYIVSTTQTAASGSGYDGAYAHDLWIGATDAGKLARILPTANNKVSLGTTSKRFLTAYFTDIKFGTGGTTLVPNAANDLTYGERLLLKMDNPTTHGTEQWVFDIAQDSGGTYRKYIYGSNTIADGTINESFHYIGYKDSFGTWSYAPMTQVASYYIKAGDGTSTGPAYSFITDPNTGFYSISSGFVGYSDDNTYRVGFGNNTAHTTQSSSDVSPVATGAEFGVAGAAIINSYLYAGSVFPKTDNVDDLGSSTRRWDDIYTASGNIATSDIRLKEAIKPTALGLDFINDLNPVSYKWIDKRNGDKPDQTHYGIIAQEVIETLKKHGIDSIMDFGGIHGEEETYYGTRYQEFIPILMKAVQELSVEVKELKEKN